MKNIILFCGLFLLSYSCKPKADSSQDKVGDMQEQQVPVASTTSLPSIPEELLKKIFLECDFVDYIFYELPFSMSYDQQSTIQSVLGWVDASTKIPTSGCKVLARMIFQSQGEIMIEADVYVNEQCAYYKWYMDGKPVYNNLMTLQGINHYTGIIKQFEKK